MSNRRPNPLFAFLDGKEYVLDGIHGFFKHECVYVLTGSRSVDLNGYTHLMDKLVSEKLIHVKSDVGMTTPQYKATKRELGDDWESNLTNYIDRYYAIAYSLGYRKSCYLEEPEPKLLLRRGDYILIRYGADEFTVYESPDMAWEREGSANYGQTFSSIGEAARYLLSTCNVKAA